jgi:hypothetical protein
MKETLRQKQSRFVKMIALLINYAYHQGFELTFPDCRLKHMENSLHYIGLAIDLNLFKDGVWLKSTEAYTSLGEFWEQLSGTWGGRFSVKDGCHFSLPYNGRK